MHRGGTEISMPLFCYLFQSGYSLLLNHCTLQHVWTQGCHSQLLTKEFLSRSHLSRRRWERPKKSCCQMQVDEALALISFKNIIQSLMNQCDFPYNFKALGNKLFSYRWRRKLVTQLHTNVTFFKFCLSCYLSQKSRSAQAIVLSEKQYEPA